MDESTKQRIENVVEQDADQLLAVATADAGSKQEVHVIADVPPTEIAELIGLLLLAGEEALDVPAPLIAYEASKRAEMYEDASELMIAQGLGGRDGSD